MGVYSTIVSNRRSRRRHRRALDAAQTLAAKIKARRQERFEQAWLEAFMEATRIRFRRLFLEAGFIAPGQVDEDTCLDHGEFLCPECFDLVPFE